MRLLHKLVRAGIFIGQNITGKYKMPENTRWTKMLKNILALSLISLIFIGITSCVEGDKVNVVNLEEKKVFDVEDMYQKENAIRIAIGTMITPTEGYVYYKQFLDYVGEKIGRPVKFIVKENYSEVNNLLRSGDIDVAFVCGRPYVDGHDEFGLELLVAPQVNGESVYYSYFIVHIDSPIKTLDELRGKTFAFTDPKSNSGKLVPTYMLYKMNETESFFKEYVFTYAHDKSIKAVAQKIVDGAAVDSLIWEFYNKMHTEITSKTKIILKSPAHGIPPVVVSSRIDPEIKKRLRKVFLSLHEDEKGKKMLNKMMIDKFVMVDDTNYNSIREMIAHLEQKNKG